MKITDVLRGEHGVFYAQFDYLEQAAPAAGSLAEVRSLTAMLAAALAPHAQMEDEILFAALDPYLGQMGPLAVMRLEHNEIEGALAGMPGVQEVGQARETLLHALAVARDHFAKEEQVLFMMAEQVLDEETLDRLGRAWTERRGVVVV